MLSSNLQIYKFNDLKMNMWCSLRSDTRKKIS